MTTLGLAGVASAQVSPVTPAPSETPAAAGTTAASGATSGVAEVVVTGSRIRQPNLTSVSPMTVVSDQEVKLSGASNIENLLNSLPQVTPGQQSNVSNGASGTATIDLRDLGPSRTLVLVDGRRLMPGDPVTPFADLNNIPSAMIERVDVVTGGASSVYGADAVSGVVNFILKKDFQGAQIDAQYGLTTHDNGNPVRALQGVQGLSNYPLAPSNFTHGLSTDVSLILGVNSPDDKGNITAYATYRNLQAITQDNYDVSACTIAASHVSGADSYNYNGHACIGSSNSQYGRFTLQGTILDPSTGKVIFPSSRYPGSFGSTRFHVNPNGTQTFVSTAVPGYNYAPLNYFQRPEDRYTAGFKAHYRVNEHFDVYSDLMFADDHTVAQIAPSGLFAGTGSNKTSYYQINCNNPLLAGSEQTQLCGTMAGTPTLVNVQAGFRFAGFNRQDDLRHTNYKIDVGVRGDIIPGWTYDAYLQYGTSIFNEHYNNDASIRKIQNALLVDPATGKCITDSAQCVPLNIFQFGKLTNNMLSYVLTPGFKSGETIEQIASASVTGDLGQYGIKSPLANNGIGLAFGAEYRSEILHYQTDAEFTAGDLSGQGGPSLGSNGSFDVYELFGEARIPIVEDKPFFKSLALDFGYRFSDYSLAGITNTYKGEGDWAITPDIRFRAGYNRAVRAPNLVELFTPSSIGLFGGSDPCAGQTTYTQGCVNTFRLLASQLGVTPETASAGLTNISQCPASQCSATFSGNRALKPEIADTYTAGVVFTPTFHYLRGFTASIDYYKIDVYNQISAPSPQVLLNECVNGILSACDNVQRDPSSGIIYGNQGYVVDTTINGGYTKTQGVDITANYRFRFTDWGLPDYGTFQISLIGSYVDKLTTKPVAGGPNYECAGLYGTTCGTPIPHWKNKVRLTYTPPRFPVSVSVDWRHVGAVKLDGNEGTQGALPNGVPLAVDTGNYLLANHPSGITDTVDERIHPYDYFDISATWKVRDNLNFRAGVANVADTDPPVLDSGDLPASGPPTGNGNTYPGVYDSLGRTIFVGLTADF